MLDSILLTIPLFFTGIKLYIHMVVRLASCLCASCYPPGRLLRISPWVCGLEEGEITLKEQRSNLFWNLISLVPLSAVAYAYFDTFF